MKANGQIRQTPTKLLNTAQTTDIPASCPANTVGCLCLSGSHYYAIQAFTAFAYLSLSVDLNQRIPSCRTPLLFHSMYGFSKLWSLSSPSPLSRFSVAYCVCCVKAVFLSFVIDGLSHVVHRQLDGRQSDGQTPSCHSTISRSGQQQLGFAINSCPLSQHTTAQRRRWTAGQHSD